jgi:hypothetical protein
MIDATILVIGIYTATLFICGIGIGIDRICDKIGV